MPRVNESDEDQDQVFSAEFEDEEDHEPAVDEAHEVLGPVEAVQSMKKEFDSLVERMNGKITELQTVIQEVPFTAPRVPGTRHKSMSSKEALAQAKEPSVLVKRRENRTKEEEEKKECSTVLGAMVLQSVAEMAAMKFVFMAGGWNWPPSLVGSPWIPSQVQGNTSKRLDIPHWKCSRKLDSAFHSGIPKAISS